MEESLKENTLEKVEDVIQSREREEDIVVTENQVVLNREAINQEVINQEAINQEVINQEAINQEVKNIKTENQTEINVHPELELIKFLKQKMMLPDTDIKSYSPLTLAYIGDGVYDLIIRTVIVEKGNAPVNKLHKHVSNLVKAPAQMELFRKVEDKLTQEEIAIYKRGRNSKSFTMAKNASVSDYRIATGLEALVGYLYLDNQFARIIEIIKMGLEG